MCIRDSNMGVGEAKDNAKLLESAVKDMETITGQKAVLTKAKNSVANFKICLLYTSLRLRPRRQ